MKSKYTFNHFISDVKQYASAYDRLELAQKNETQSFIPKKGDQKTGLIGEAFIHQFLIKKKYKNLEFGNCSTHAWDINGMLKGKKCSIQVKTVSGFSETRVLSPIHRGWDTLYLLSLDKKFIPNGLWVIDNCSDIEWQNRPGKNGKIIEHLSYQKMRKPGVETSGSSRLFEHARCVFSEFKKLMPELYN